MSKKKPNPNAFSDVIPLMETAVVRGSIRYRVADYGKAVNIRQRCYTWRTQMQRQAAEVVGEVPGLIPSTPYDNLTIRIEDQLGIAHNRRPPDPKQLFDVVIAQREVVSGELLDADGNPINFATLSEYSSFTVDEDWDETYDPTSFLNLNQTSTPEE